MKQYFSLLLLPTLLVITSCHKERYYSCICSYKNDSMEVYRIGRMQKEDAYTKCRTYLDSTTTCYVEDRK